MEWEKLPRASILKSWSSVDILMVRHCRDYFEKSIIYPQNKGFYIGAECKEFEPCR